MKEKLLKTVDNIMDQLISVALNRFNIINANQGNSHNACKHYYLSSVERGGFNPLIVKTCEYCHFIREGCRKKK